MRALRGDDAAVPGPRPHRRRARGGGDASRRVLVLPEALPLRDEATAVRAPGGRAGGDAGRTEDQARRAENAASIAAPIYLVALSHELELLSGTARGADDHVELAWPGPAR